MNEDLKNLQLDRIDKRGKNPDQMQKHSIDPHLENKPIEKALYLLSKGDEVQKLSVIESLPQLLAIDTGAALSKVLPKIQQELTKSSSELHVATSRVFLVLFASSHKVNGNLTPIILQGLESKDPVIASAWLETLLEIINFLPIRTVQAEILSIAIIKGQCTQATCSRIASCRILGKIALHSYMKPLEIKKDVLPTVYSLCQDVNHTVRATICEQLPAIAKGLGMNLVKNLLLSNLVELSSDDNANVRAIAVSTVIKILPFVDKETKVNALVNLVMNWCGTTGKVEDVASIILAKDMGMVFNSLENCLTQAQVEKLLHFYQQVANRGLDTKGVSIYSMDSSQDVKGREYSAFNFPAVLSFSMAVSPSQVNQLYSIFKNLTYDSCFIVRQAVARVFNEVARILGPKNSMMKTEFVRLLRDDAEEVLENLVPSVSSILLLFITYDTLSLERQDNTSNEITKALLKCLLQLTKGYNWRLTANLLKQLEILPMIFKSDHINSDFTPHAINMALRGRTKPVRSQAVRTLLIFLRWNIKVMQRTWLKDHLIHELADSKCCYTRQTFIELCKHAMDIFSNKYFKENFFNPVLKLSADNVSTVRYSAVNLFPRIKKMIRLPQDRKLLTVFDQVIINMEKNEKDRDVLANLITKTKEMMSPMASITSEDAEAREKRLIEEEENVAKGKITFNAVSAEHEHGRKKTSSAKVAGHPLRSFSSTRDVTKLPSSSSIGQGRPISISPRTVGGPSTNIQRPELISDMTFLKQHFYIDAGVNLPIEGDNPEEEPIATNTNPPIRTVYNTDSVTNMTDDVKVNMRHKKIDKTQMKRFSHSEIPTYSPSLVDKRRSLNIQREVSKIPVILKSVENVQTYHKILKHEEKNFKRNSSNLPVPIKRTNSSIR